MSILRDKMTNTLFNKMPPKPVSSIAEHIFDKNLECDNIVINLANNSNRALDVISKGSQICIHIRVDKSICQTCGAFVGHLGYEKDVLLFYKHVNLLANSVFADNVYLISPRYYPEDYSLPLFGMRVQGYSSYSHVRTYTVYNRVSSDPHSTARVSTFYIIQFTKDPTNLWASRCILSKKLSMIDYLNEKPTLVVNPTKQDVNTEETRFTFYLS